MLRFFKSAFLLCFLLLSVSCGRKLTETGKVQEKVQRRRTPELVAAMDSLSKLRPKTFYSKIKCDFADTNQNVSFKTSLRMVKDSVVNTLITYAGIPIVNALINQDSVIISNKRERCVIRQNLGFFKEEFGVDFDYRNIEELFLGLPLGFDTTQKYFQIHDPYNYILSSHKKREIRRENRNRPERDRDRDRERDRDRDRRRDNDNEEEESEENIILNYYLSGDARTIERIFINSVDDSTTIDIRYLTRDSVSQYMIPNDVAIDIVTPRNHIVLQMDYDKSEVDAPQEIYFVIPEGYEACIPKEE